MKNGNSAVENCKLKFIVKLSLDADFSEQNKNQFELIDESGQGDNQLLISIEKTECYSLGVTPNGNYILYYVRYNLLRWVI